jgi:hypothetical protein
MDIQSLFFTFLVAVVSTVIMIQLIQFLAKRNKLVPQENQKLSISFAVWFMSLLIAFSLYLKVALIQVENAIEFLIYANDGKNTFLAVMEKIAIFIGFTFLATFLILFIVNVVFKFSFKNRVDQFEMENDNNGYFLLKGLVLIVLVFITLPVFEHFLMWFLPKIETPFFR